MKAGRINLIDNWKTFLKEFDLVMKKIFFYLLSFAGNLLLSCISFPGCTQNKKENKNFTESLMQDSCSFLPTGRNTYFILEPGYQLVLEGIEEADTVRLIFTVLDEIKKIGNAETRIVEEKETVNGETAEISRNFFAFCLQNGGIYYFGEEVDNYEKGKVVNHEGAWIAGGKNKAGLLMPGVILLGARYSQEIAPGIAMDRAEIISINENVQTPAGKFSNCLKTEETNALKPKEKEFKYYAAGIGLVKEEELRLIKYGFIK
jgi:hypothetical protein